jgi:two-component system response regulator DesR
VIRIVVAEDMHMIRTAMAALIETEDGMEVVGEAERGDVVLDLVRRTRPDLVLLDLDMPGADGLTVLSQLTAETPRPKVVILTAVGRPAAVRTALTAGVDGFILKSAPATELLDGLRAVAGGRRVLAPDLAAAAVVKGDSPLTTREADVLALVGKGSAVPDIAAALHLSEGTVRNYLTGVVDKLDARSRTDAVRIAESNGWI